MAPATFGALGGINGRTHEARSSLLARLTSQCEDRLVDKPRPVGEVVASLNTQQQKLQGLERKLRRLKQRSPSPRSRSGPLRSTTLPDSRLSQPLPSHALPGSSALDGSDQNNLAVFLESVASRIDALDHQLRSMAAPSPASDARAEAVAALQHNALRRDVDSYWPSRCVGNGARRALSADGLGGRRYWTRPERAFVEPLPTGGLVSPSAYSDAAGVDPNIMSLQQLAATAVTAAEDALGGHHNGRPGRSPDRLHVHLWASPPPPPEPGAVSPSSHTPLMPTEGSRRDLSAWQEIAAAAAESATVAGVDTVAGGASMVPSFDAPRLIERTSIGTGPMSTSPSSIVGNVVAAPAGTFSAGTTPVQSTFTAEHMMQSPSPSSAIMFAEHPQPRVNAAPVPNSTLAPGPHGGGPLGGGRVGVPSAPLSEPLGRPPVGQLMPFRSPPSPRGAARPYSTGSASLGPSSVAANSLPVFSQSDAAAFAEMGGMKPQPKDAVICFPGADMPPDGGRPVAENFSATPTMPSYDPLLGGRLVAENFGATPPMPYYDPLLGGRPVAENFGAAPIMPSYEPTPPFHTMVGPSERAGSAAAPVGFGASMPSVSLSRPMSAGPTGRGGYYGVVHQGLPSAHGLRDLREHDRESFPPGESIQRLQSSYSSRPTWYDGNSDASLSARGLNNIFLTSGNEGQFHGVVRPPERPDNFPQDVSWAK